MNWLLDPAPAIRFCSSAEFIIVAPIPRACALDDGVAHSLNRHSIVTPMLAHFAVSNVRLSR
jgi:hypothetical protein